MQWSKLGLRPRGSALLLCFLDVCGVQFKQIPVRGYKSPLISLSFIRLQVRLKRTSPWSHTASLFLHSAVLISFGRRTRRG